MQLFSCRLLKGLVTVGVVALGFILDPSDCSAQASTLSRAVRTTETMQPAIPRPEQDRAVARKLAALEQRTGKKPNVVWIIVDDMGYGDPGCYGGGITLGAATPNMDRLAREGLRLTSCYSQQTCTPTRSAILTGRLPVRTGLVRPILAGDTLLANPWKDETSLAKILGESGYYTLLSGKWHVGEIDGMRPHEVGFDEYYGYYPAQKEITQALDPRRFPDLVLDKEKFDAYQKMEMSHDLVHGLKGAKTRVVSSIKSLDDMGRADEGLADFTIKKIKELSKGKAPFFVEHCFMKVHADNFANPKYRGSSASKYAYKDGIVEVDLLIKG